MNESRRNGHLGLTVRIGMCAAVALIALPAAGPAGAAANPTKLSIACVPKALSPGVAAACTATVTDSGPVAARVPPTGTVTLSVDGAGSFDPSDSCALEESGAFSSRCALSYTPTAISGGTHTLLGTYGGDDGHGRATAQFALAVTPVNDELDAATRLAVPGRLTGTTEGATYNYDDDPDLCSDAYAPVWYTIKPAASGRIAVRLTVRGRVDSVVAVFRQDRSKLTDLGCALTDAAGVAGVPFDAERGASYLVAVAAPWDARSGGFTLESAVVPAVRFPGARLGRAADVALDPLLRPGAAFSVQLHDATTYRVDASAPGACVHVKLLRRGSTSDADAAVARSDGCSGYLVYTPGPGEGGVLPLVVSMPEGAAARIHVAIRQAEGDDLAPGVPLANGETRRGRLTATEADVVDVYRFDVGVRGDADLELHGSVRADVLLLDDRGGRVACGCAGLKTESLVQRVAPGSYLAVVRARAAASGAYALSLRLRTPTATGIRLKAAGGVLTAVATVSPGGVAGRLVLEVDRYDPLTQWHFVRAAAHPVAHGGTAFALAPSLGGWRVRARYAGTTRASASDSPWVAFSVEPGKRGGRRAGTCGPSANATFAVGVLTVTCTGFATDTRPEPAAGGGPTDAVAKLKAQVEAISLLKDPFKSDLLSALDDVSAALGDGKAADAKAALDAFLGTLRASALQAQVPADTRAQLAAAATAIRRSLG